MKKPPAISAHHAKREKLRAMAERGTKHEARIASAKLAKLEAEVDFGGAPERETPDLFPAFRSSPREAALRTGF